MPFVPLPPTTSSNPGPSQNPLLTLRHTQYGLLSNLVNNLEPLSVRAIYLWQFPSLLGKGFLNGEWDLVHTAPTGEESL